MAKVCFCVPADATQLIAGRSFENLKRISEKSQTSINIQSSNDVQAGSNQRLVIIEGAREKIVAAVEAIIPVVVNRKSIEPSPVDTAIFEIQWLIPRCRCGPLIGEKGAGIKNIITLTGANVSIYESMENQILDEKFEIV